MARKLRTKIANRADRLALARRRKPYSYTAVSPGCRLGYRRNDGAGTWVAEYADGKGGAEQMRIATADDFQDANDNDVLTFWQASERARQMKPGNVGAGTPATWAQALDDYEADLKARGGNLYNARQVRSRLAADAPTLLTKPVALLAAAELTRWRNDLVASHLKPGSVARLLKSARASLNLAANHDPRIQNRNAWRVGLGGLTDTDTYVPINRVVSDAVVHRIIAESYALDAEFGLFVHVAAETGARASQITRLLVSDLHGDMLMMPSSKKGKRRSVTRRPVPISAELAARLKRVAAGRAADEPLLLRAGKAFNPVDTRHLQKPFAIVAERVGIKATMYALRHAAITRSLLAGVPARLVGANADTSLAMLERTYSRFISHHGEDISRRGLLAATGNVVRLKKRRA
jgi:integrase